VKVMLLGTGSSTLSANKLPSSCIVTTDRGNLLIDIGPSIVRRLLEYGYSMSDIDIIILTHFHPDHTVDLATFLFSCNYGNPQRTKPLTIIGGKGIKQFINRLNRLYPWVKPINFDISVKTLPKGRYITHGLSIATKPVEHREESIAIRIEENGRSFVYSGDTDYSPSLVDLANQVDVMVVECTCPVQKEKGHLNLAALSHMVTRIQSHRVVLTHLDPQWDMYHAPLPEPFLLGEDGMEIEI
jgi:ribonuclease BN (tRNA processing enzyme)